MIEQRELDNLQTYFTVPIELQNQGGKDVLRLRLPEDDDGHRGILAISAGLDGVELSDQSSIP